ncbi:hypothetical protein Avbf_14740 [Armadillidium vulgare]|nr:hypothetical protein Avbf_14740 [Armadillidium vulgare]
MSDQEEKTVDRKIDNYIATVMNFHNHVGLHGKKKKPQPVKDDLYSNMSLIEDAIKCELNIREDLLKEKSELENELKGLQIKLKSLEEERTKEKQMVLFKLKEAIKVRNEISDPKKVSSIQKLEREISDMEQEIELLKNAYETLQKETGTEKPKFQFKRNLLSTRDYI